MLSLGHPLSKLVVACQQTIDGNVPDTTHVHRVIDEAMFYYVQKAGRAPMNKEESEVYTEVMAYLELKQLACHLDAEIPMVEAVHRRANFPPATIEILQQWLFEHASYPFPTDAEKTQLSERANITVKQVSDWFMNARRRRKV